MCDAAVTSETLRYRRLIVTIHVRHHEDVHSCVLVLAETSAR